MISAMTAAIANPAPVSVRFGQGGVIFREGERATVAYLVIEGVVRPHTRDADQLRFIGDVTAGGFFGEIALLNDETYPISAVAATDVRLAVVRPEAFARQVEASPPLVRATMRRLLSIVKRLKAAHAGSLEQLVK